MLTQKTYSLSITTQGPTYPPSEVMDENGNFIVIGQLNQEDPTTGCRQTWGGAIVCSTSSIPNFGRNDPYKIIKSLDLNCLTQAEKKIVLHTLPLPLPCNNYPMIFAPEQNPTFKNQRVSYPFHLAPIPDLREEDGRKQKEPITLEQWITAQGELKVSLADNKKTAHFEFEFRKLIPNSLYTIMALREHDLNPDKLTRPGPLGVPNVFITDENGNGKYQATMPNPFPTNGQTRNRIINVVVLWMSTQMSYGGAIGHYGLGGDIHAQLKLKTKSFFEFETINS